MELATCALMPSVPEEGLRPCAPFGAHQEDSVFLKNSGTRGGGPWDREAKGRLPNSALSIFGGADDLPQMRTTQRPQATRQDAPLPSLRASSDLPPCADGDGMTDAFTHASPGYQRTLRGRVRDRSAPIVSSREPAAMPDPREFDPRTAGRCRVIRNVVSLVAVVAFVTAVWAVLS